MSETFPDHHNERPRSLSSLALLLNRVGADSKKGDLVIAFDEYYEALTGHEPSNDIRQQALPDVDASGEELSQRQTLEQLLRFSVIELGALSEELDCNALPDYTSAVIKASKLLSNDGHGDACITVGQKCAIGSICFMNELSAYLTHMVCKPDFEDAGYTIDPDTMRRIAEHRFNSYYNAWHQSANIQKAREGPMLSYFKLFEARQHMNLPIELREIEDYNKLSRPPRSPVAKNIDKIKGMRFSPVGTIITIQDYLRACRSNGRNMNIPSEAILSYANCRKPEQMVVGTTWLTALATEPHLDSKEKQYMHEDIVQTVLETFPKHSADCLPYSNGSEGCLQVDLCPAVMVYNLLALEIIEADFSHEAYHDNPQNVRDTYVARFEALIASDLIPKHIKAEAAKELETYERSFSNVFGRA